MMSSKKKASIPLKMYLKKLVLENASISLKKSSKIVEIFMKAPHFQTEASIFREMSIKNLDIYIKSS
jgi:hypothetical protein